MTDSRIIPNVLPLETFIASAIDRGLEVIHERKITKSDVSKFMTEFENLILNFPSMLANAEAGRLDIYFEEEAETTEISDVINEMRNMFLSLAIELNELKE